MKTRYLLGAAAALAVAAPLVAYSAGMWSNWPVIGQGAYCSSYVSGTVNPNSQGPYGVVPGLTQGSGVQGICGQTVPAGPVGVTGQELIPSDLNVNGGYPTQSALLPNAIAGPLNTKVNRLIGGDMTTNPNQRSATTKGIASLAATSPTAAIITADRWWVIAPAAEVTTTIDSGTTAVIPGVNNKKAIRVARTTSGAAGITCLGQTLDSVQAAPLIGNNAVFSFYEFNGAGQSATNGNITVNIDYTSQADAAGTQATLGYAGANGSIFALGDTGGSTTGLANYTNAIATISPGFPGSVSYSSPATGSIAAGVATIQASTAWTRYSVAAFIPTNINGTTTPVTEVSVSICFTPTATTAITTDYIELDDMQLQAMPGGASVDFPATAGGQPTTNAPGVVTAVNGVNYYAIAGLQGPTGFEYRPAALEAEYAYYYWWFNYENQSLINVVGTCENTATSVTNCLVPFPEPMRIVPVGKYTAGFQAFAQVAETSVSACSALANAASYAVVPATNAVFLACTATVGAAGTANELTSLGTSSATGIISISAEP